MASAATNPGGGGGKHQPPEVLVERLFKRIGEVSSLPVVAMRIIEVANNPKTGAEDLLEAVRFDAALGLDKQRIGSIWEQLDETLAAADIGVLARAG